MQRAQDSGVPVIRAGTRGIEPATRSTLGRYIIKRCPIIWTDAGFQSGPPLGCMGFQANNFCGLCLYKQFD